MRNRSRTRSVSARRKLVWVDTVFQQSLATNDNLVIDLLTSARVAGASVLGATVGRTLVRLNNGSAAISRQDAIYWGLCVTDSNDVGLNTAGAPNAHTTPNLDWAWRSYDQSSFGTDGTALGAYFPGGSNMKDYDVKSQRKVQEMNQTWALVINQAALTTAGNGVWSIFTRVMLRLP